MGGGSDSEIGLLAIDFIASIPLVLELVVSLCILTGGERGWR